MELVNNNSVVFDEAAHTYTLPDGRHLIGVTALMKKHGLSADYSGIPEAVLAEAARKGTAIHRELQDYDEGLPVEESRLIKGYRKLGLRHIASEYLVSDNETVASSIDKVYATDSDTEVWIVDIKTTTKLHTEALEWQLGIYKVLFERQNPGIAVSRCSCLQIDKNTGKIVCMADITPVSESRVDALIAAERNGEIYIEAQDEPELPSADPFTEELEAFGNAAAKLASLQAAAKQLEAVQKAASEKIMEEMRKRGVDKLDCPAGVFSIRKGSVRTTIDSKRLKAEMPEVAEKYTKTSVVAETLTFKAKGTEE